MKKIIIAIVVLAILFGVYIFYQLQKDNNQSVISTQVAYYQELRDECKTKDSESCCLSSVERIEKSNFHKVSKDGVCDYGYKKNTLRCPSAFAWCEPKSINDTSKYDFYDRLEKQCQVTRYTKNEISCCLDSVKTMEVVGSVKLFPEGNDKKGGKYQCPDGLKRMTLRCPGSYTWCQTSSNPEGEDFVPVPKEVPTINPGAWYDDKGNGPICTMEAKSCPDGSFVGRTGPNCEFAKCPGKKRKPDFVPTKNNPIELPNNIMTIKECTGAGGEVFNTLGQTAYNGEFIGKIDELRCPCACLVKGKEDDILWVVKNGNKEKFTGNLKDIQTFEDCKNAGFKILKTSPETCQVGEPHMTGGKYITFTNNPIKDGKTCADYHYSTCPGSCVAKCVSSSCGEPSEDETVDCTSDCDGAGSCIAK